MGVGVNARGSDGIYATVYCRCLIFYGRQYVSYSIYCIFEEFHSKMTCLSPVLMVTASMIVTLTNEYIQYMIFFFFFF